MSKDLQSLEKILEKTAPSKKKNSKHKILKTEFGVLEGQEAIVEVENREQPGQFVQVL